MILNIAVGYNIHVACAVGEKVHAIELICCSSTALNSVCLCVFSLNGHHELNGGTLFSFLVVVFCCPSIVVKTTTKKNPQTYRTAINFINNIKDLLLALSFPLVLIDVTVWEEKRGAVMEWTVKHDSNPVTTKAIDGFLKSWIIG